MLMELEASLEARPNARLTRRAYVLGGIQLGLVLTWAYGILHSPYPLNFIDDQWPFSFIAFVVAVTLGSLPGLLALRGGWVARDEGTGATFALMTAGALMIAQGVIGILLARWRSSEFEGIYKTLSEPDYATISAGGGFRLLVYVSIAVAAVGVAAFIVAVTSSDATIAEEL
jgi:hypothetical protein